jgi:cyclophilin family peptidyl-prolyl cis-trans isomerase
MSDATFVTSMGSFTVRLMPEHAPSTVANFVELAKGAKEWTDPRDGSRSTDPLYDGTVFHRVIGNFMIQGGDPAGTGTGGPGYTFEDEVPDDGPRFDQGPGPAGDRHRAGAGRDLGLTEHREPRAPGRGLLTRDDPRRCGRRAIASARDVRA